jgi:hypothetical protein
MKQVWLAATMVAASITVAHSAGAPHWVMQASDGNCALRQELQDASGAPAGDLAITSDRDYGPEANVRIYRGTADGIVRLSQPGTLNAWSKPLGDGGAIKKGAGVFNLLNPLREGQPLLVEVITPGKPTARYTTSKAGVADAVGAFNRCAAALPASQEPQPRWEAGADSSDCTVHQQRFGAVNGLSVRFETIKSGGVTLVFYADDRLFPRGGALHIELPGAQAPWIVESGHVAFPVDPRGRALLDALRRASNLRMSFHPQDGPTVRIEPRLDNLPVAASMMDACLRARARPVPPKVAQFSELRYALSDSDAGCELTGVYRIESQAVWLALSTDGRKNVLKVTQRTIRAGYKVAALDLEKLGGARRMSAPDASIDLDATAFGALRRDLMGSGREFRILLTNDAGYSTRFGGDYGAVESAMFDACVRAKYPAQP